MYPQSNGQLDWNERFDTAVDIGTGGSVFGDNGDVYRRFQDIDGGSNSSASNDTESTTLLDETCRKNERLYDITPKDRGDRHSRGSTKNKCFLWIIAFCLIGIVGFGIIPNNNDRGRIGTIAGWGLNTSRATIGYVLPYENTTLIDPLNVCTTEERSGLVEESEKVFLLIVVCSAAPNFESRQAIRETWGKGRDFNYAQFQSLHERLHGEYLDPKRTVGPELKKYLWQMAEADESLATLATEGNNVHSKSNSSHSEQSDASSFAGMILSVKVVFLVGQSEADYVHQRQRSAIPSAGDSESTVKRSAIVQQAPTLAGAAATLPGADPSHNPSDSTSHSSLFPSGPDVDPAFNAASNEMVDELQLRIVNESEVYGDIIQESFIDSYNNLTLKTIMMLKWVTNNCDGKEPQVEDRRPVHDQKQYLLFKLETREYSGDIDARLMVYVHGEEWLKNNIRQEMAGRQEQEVMFTVGKTGGKAGGVIEHARKEIPKGAGQFVQFNVTDLVLEWFKERELGSARTSKYIVIETLNDLARKLVVNSPTESKFVRSLF
ncbi:uncharacterized protein LOC128310129 isoform X2 [Anopheles moucheti]|uniref:uncharacterized protein LOC128310129 isoform X2 n=1 Tax=Anopheles moucheti TaxID=186751 RepID=UPI0022F03872|nr:uncharacterized protein LOC128310129 isoform X2 [Anopheles moucheti]